MKNLLLDSQTRHSNKGKSTYSADIRILPGDTLLTLIRNDSRGKKNKIIIPLIPPVEDERWLIMRMNRMQERKIIPILASSYPILYTRQLIGYFFIQGNAPKICQLIADYGFEAYCLSRRNTYKTGRKTVFYSPETLDYDFVVRFMQVLSDRQSRFSIAPHPLESYAAGNEKLICVAGPLKGFTGYIVRSHRTRKLFFRISDTITACTESIRDSLFITCSQYEAASKK